MDKKFEEVLHTYKRVVVLWRDSTQHSGWIEISKVKLLQASLCVSTAFLIANDGKNLVLAGTVSPPDSDETTWTTSEVFVIPLECVISIDGVE